MNTDCMPRSTHDCGEREEPGSSAEGDGPPEPADRPAPHTIELVPGNGVAAGPWLSALQTATQNVLPLLPRSVARVSVRFVHDAEMIELHAQWHGINSTTDVITFEHAVDGPLEVDLAVCVDEAARAASTRKHDAQAELLLYILHGLLHCCGFNDSTEEESLAMHHEEDRLLAAMGHPAVFGSEEAAS